MCKSEQRALGEMSTVKKGQTDGAKHGGVHLGERRLLEREEERGRADSRTQGSVQFETERDDVRQEGGRSRSTGVEGRGEEDQRGRLPESCQKSMQQGVWNGSMKGYRQQALRGPGGKYSVGPQG